MGSVKDNYYLSVHRQEHFELPEFMLRHHLGAQAIDREHRLTVEQFADLLLRCVGAEPHFRSKLREYAPQFCAQLPAHGYPSFQRLFQDVRAINEPHAVKQ